MRRAEIQNLLGLTHRENFAQNYLQPAIAEGIIELTIPDKPNSPKQTYRLTAKGLELQEQLKSR